MLREEFEVLMADSTKRVIGDIAWEVSDSDPAARTFRTSVNSDSLHPLIVQGWYSPRREKLSYALVYNQEGVGRIYGLDFGASHPNPDGTKAGDPHKNYWTEDDGDSWAYEPTDISAPWNDPVRAWTEFCAEANIRFFGIMQPP